MKMTSLSAEQAAGQRLMIGFDGTELNPRLKFYIDTLKIGGVILFSRNIVSPEQVARLCGSIQAYACDCGQPPLFIGIDQEGGKVARLKAPFTEFPGNPAMKGTADAVKFSRVTAAELTAIGVNMNLAPVLDIVPRGVIGVMTDRVFGSDPGWVSRLGLTVISNLQKRGIMAVAKHFPGIGRTTLDSHLDRPFLDTDFESLNRTDLIPFKKAVVGQVAGVMLSHIVYTDLDAHWPASLSPKIAKKLLRKKLGHKCLILTDDLDMGAIVKHYDIDTVMAQIIAADIDMALICHESPKIEMAFEILLGQHAQKMRAPGRSGPLQRILRFKRKFLETA